MPDPLRPLRVDAVELLRQPGATRPLDVAIAPEPLGILHERVRGDVRIDLLLESTGDRIDVRGVVFTDWSTVCRRCLRDLRGADELTVDERYQRPHARDAVDPDAFVIEGNQLDLAPMVRDTVLLALDDERVCRDDCAGLCPVCGLDRNLERCECSTEVRDERWAALADIVLDDD